MPYYDFLCKKCEILVEDEFFKIADEKKVECIECGKRMEQIILKAPGLSDPAGIGRKWTNDGYQMKDEKSGKLRTVNEKWEKGKNVIRSDVHKDDPNIIKEWNKDVRHVPGRFKAHHDKYWGNEKSAAGKWYKNWVKRNTFKEVKK